MNNKKLLPPKTRPPTWLTRLASGLMSIAFIVFVCWIFNGAAQGGWFLWGVIALFAAPILLYLLFIAGVGLSFVRHARRNVREAQRQRDKR